MDCCTVHVGDEGVTLRYTLKDEDGDPVDISTATSMELKVENFDGTVKTLTGAFETDGTDGVVVFVSAADTWVAVGTSIEQVQITFPSGTLSACEVCRNVRRKL